MKKVKTFIIPISFAITIFFFGLYFKDINKLFVDMYNNKIELNNPTWSYTNEPKIPNSRVVEINYPFNDTKKVVVNSKYNLDNRHFKKKNNKVIILVPNRIEISTIILIDNSNKKHSIQKN